MHAPLLSTNVCSTDTQYFQRLTPYPRCFLRQSSIRFKDYESNPIGFGIAIVCMASPRSDASAMYQRFHEHFAPRGEVNIPIDDIFIGSSEFMQLALRLRVGSVTHPPTCMHICTHTCTLVHTNIYIYTHTCTLKNIGVTYSREESLCTGN